MGNATIFYTPLGNSADVEPVEIDLGESLSTLEDYDMRDESIADGFSGVRRRVVFTATRCVDATMAMIDDYSVIRQLEGLMSHLRRGGLCTLAEDGDLTFAAYLDSWPVNTTPTIRWTTNLYEAFGGVYTPTAGDILALCGPSPEMQWAEVEVSSGTTTSAVLTEVPVDDWLEAAWVLVRHKGFWPALRLRKDAPQAGLISHGNRITFDLNLPLEVPPNAFDALAVEPDVPIVPGVGGTIDIRVNRIDDWARSDDDGPELGGTWRGW